MKRNRYITLPENWDELTSDDWREMLRIRHIVASTDHQWTVEDVRIESARALLKSRGVRQQLSNPQWLLLVSQLAQSLTWLWTEDEGRLSLVYRSTENLMPCLAIGTGKKSQTLKGPVSHGYDLTFGEFRQALQHLKAYENPVGETEAERIEYRTTALCVLAGLLYRPEASEDQRHQGLLRQPYDWDGFDDKMARGRRMKPWQLWGIYAWFAYFCEALTTETFIIEGEEICFAPLFESGKQGDKDQGETAGTMAHICHTLAETHVFGTARDVDRTPLLTVMQKLLQDYYTLQKLKKVKK